MLVRKKGIAQSGSSASAASSSQLVPVDSQEVTALAQVSQDDTIAELRAHLQRAQKQARYYKSKAIVAFQKARDVERKNQELLARLNFRPGLRHISTFGGYTLALKRNLAGVNVSGAACASLVAGDDERGSFGDKKVVLVWEHKAAAAKRCRSAQTHAAFLDSAHDLAPIADLAHDQHRSPSAFEIYCIKADGTNQEAIGKEKVHTSLISSLLLAGAGVYETDRAFDMATLENCVVSSREAGDLQIVKQGDGEETYALMQAELKSLGVSTWDARCTCPQAGVASAFIFGLDNGPDNVGAMKRVRGACKQNGHVMFAVVWCTFHQSHLIVKNHLTAMQSHQITGYEIDTNYFTLITSIIHVWRSTGMHEKLKASAMAEFGDASCFARLPGRPLRGRWGAIEDAEKSLVLARSQLRVLFDKLVQIPKKKASKPKLGDHEDDYEERTRAYRNNALEALHNPAFFLLVMVSKESRQPLDHLFAWSQKRVREHNKVIKDYEALGRRYLGPTPFSDLVLQKLDSVTASFTSIITGPLSAAILSHVEAHFPEDVRSHVMAQCRRIVVSLVLSNIASWKFRFVDRLSKWISFLQLLEAEPFQESGVRSANGAKYLRTPGCCLDDRDTDVFLKCRDLFADEWRRVALDGTVPLKLYVFLLLLRAEMPLDMQEVEGMNSVLQLMSKRAPTLQVPLASARLQLKKGDDISPADCVEMHDSIVAMQSSQEYLQRHQQLVLADIPPEVDIGSCPHVLARTNVRAARFALGIFHHKVIGASMV